MSVRVRFAPSPTGYLHVGGLRTALYNFLFARRHGGKCILRIEDTDRTRFVENAQENLISSLSWAGVEFDESPVAGGEYGPYIQSERFDLYTKYAKELIDNGKAYYAFDTAEELDAMREKQQKEGSAYQYDRDVMRNQLTLGDDEAKKLIESDTPYVIRMKVPSEGDVSFTDIIRGEVVVPCKDVDDQILIKSDGFPTYHLANVVDDYLMKISHVIRGEEWLPSTPKHVLLYDSFGWERPKFAHLPLLLNKDKSKLSKRQGSVAVEDFSARGYFKEAFVNFIALLGWNPTSDREIYTIDELIEFFSLEKVNKAGAVFDTQKLNWVNSQYLRSIDENELAERLSPKMEELGYPKFSNEYLAKVIVLLRERVEILSDIPEYAPYMFAKPAEYEQAYIDKHWKEGTLDLVNPLVELYSNIADWSKQTLHDETLKYVESKGLKLKDIIHPLRLMTTGKSVGAGMFETMEVLGKDECLERFKIFIEKKVS